MSLGSTLSNESIRIALIMKAIANNPFSSTAKQVQEYIHNTHRVVMCEAEVEHYCDALVEENVLKSTPAHETIFYRIK